MRYRFRFWSRQDFNRSMLVGALFPAAFAMVGAAWVGRLIFGDIGLLGGGLAAVVGYMWVIGKARLLDFHR